MKKILMLGAAILAVQAVPALAEDGKHEGKKMHMFELQDANKDGAVSEQEFVDFSKKRFTETDANKDGKVTKEEAKAHYEAKKKEWKEKREAMKREKGEAPKPELKE